MLVENVSALPLATRRMLIAAERSGGLETPFEGLAEDLAADVDRRSSRLLAALEPALIVVMFLTDIVYGFIDPRIRLGKGS